MDNIALVEDRAVEEREETRYMAEVVAPKTTTVGEFLIQELLRRGVRHVFGVPGDTVLAFYEQMEQAKATARTAGEAFYLETVNTCDEQGAGFAADAYARLNGLGVVCVTWDVGGLKVANAAAEAYAERSPLLILSGAPSHASRRRFPRIHHFVRKFQSQLEVFEELTEAAIAVTNAPEAVTEIVRLLDMAQSERGPVYLEIPSDLFLHPCVPPGALPPLPDQTLRSDPANLRDAVSEARTLIQTPGVNPVILAGVEVHRYRVQDELRRLVDKTQLSVAANLLGKSVFDETHPCYIGVYWGKMSVDAVREQVESSECVLQLGVLWTDVEQGLGQPALPAENCIVAGRKGVHVGRHEYPNVALGDFLRELTRVLPENPTKRSPRPQATWKPKDTPITVKRLFERLNAFLTPEHVVIADVGDSLFAGTELFTHSEFLSPAYYLSMGFAVPAGIGAQLALRAERRPPCRPLILVGDGSFQMTGLELSTAVRFGCNPIVIVLNNDGYTTERYLTDGTFNDILRWNYSQLKALLGAGEGCVVTTEKELEAALQAANAYTENFFLLDVHLDQRDELGRPDASASLKKFWTAKEAR